MNIGKKKLLPSDKLALEFLENAKKLNANVELIKILKSRTYKIGEANVLVRAASEGNRRYFFGINYITVEEIANIDNPFIAFICGSVERTVIIPAKLFFKHLPQISHDRNGEYKINIDRDLNIVLSGRNNRLETKQYVNAWHLLQNPPQVKAKEINNVEDSLHSIIQGRLIEIGNIRGFETYCPNKSKTFNDKKLEDLITLETCPNLQFSEYNLLRQIDVLWFKSRGDNLIPESAFEVELTTGVWSGFGRLATLLDYSSVRLYIISTDMKKYNQVVRSFAEHKERYNFVDKDDLGKLYSSEIGLRQLREEIGL